MLIQGSFGVTVELPVFWGVYVRTHAHPPKYGCPPRQFLKTLIQVFLLLGGLEGILEHVFGIYGLHILDKVPWLQGTPPIPVIIFSFSEYIVYWAVVAWMAYGRLALRVILP
jgi:hypothetical protein